MGQRSSGRAGWAAIDSGSSYAKEEASVPTRVATVYGDITNIAVESRIFPHLNSVPWWVHHLLAEIGHSGGFGLHPCDLGSLRRD
ncbi:hypothetical protein GCM10027027_11220 [Neomicrococcus lactis]